MNLFDLAAKITLDTSDYEQGLKDSQSKFSKLGKFIKGGAGTIAKVGGVALTAASGAVVAFGKASIDAGKRFDSSMSQVAATMGKTMQELEKETGSVDTAFGSFTGNLREYAQFMGKNTAFSASEAADALNYMALAGYDTEKSMKMLPNVLNLAAAGGMELATASDMVTDAQSALGLNMDETTEMVDKMAKASSKSNTSVAQLGEAFLTVGGTAKSLKGGTTELSTVLGLLADNGIKGAEGGTKLRNMILSLSAPTDDAAETMKQLGLEVFDSEGNMRSMKDIMGDLNGAMEGMTDEQKTKAISSIFNKADIKAVNALLGTSAERWDELAGEIDDAEGAAQKMADVQLDNLEGDMTLFKSALEGAQIAISDELTPSLRGLVQEGTSGLQRLTDAFQKGGIDGLMEEFSNIIAEATKKLVSGIPKLISVGGKLLFAIGSGIAKAVPGVLSTIGTFGAKMLRKLNNTIAMKLPQFGKNFAKNLKKQSKSIRDGLSTIFDEIGALLPKFLKYGMEFITYIIKGVTSSLPYVVANGVLIVNKFINGMINALPGLVSTAGEMITSFVSFIFTYLPTIWDAGTKILENLFKGIDEKKDVIKETINGVLTNIGDIIKNGLPKMISSGAELLKTMATGIKGAISVVSTVIGEILTSIGSWITENSGKLIDKGLELFNFVIDGIGNAISGITDTLGDITGKIVDWLSGDGGTKLGEKGGEIWDKIKEGLGTAIENIGETLAGIATGISGWISDHGAQILTFGQTLFNWIVSGINQGIDAIGDTIAGIASGILDWINGGEGSAALSENGTALWEAIKSGFITALDTVSQLAAKIVTGIGSWFTSNYSSIAQAGETLLGYIVDGVVAVASDIATGMLALIGQAVQWVSDHRGQILNIGISILAAIVSGIASVISNVVNGFVDFISNISGWFSDHQKDITDFGHSVITFISDGIGEWIAHIKDGFVDMVLKIQEKINSIGPFLLSIGRAILQKIINGIKEWIGHIADWVKDIPAKIQSGLNKIASDLLGLGGALIRKIKAGITDNGVTQKVISIVQAAIKAGKALLDKNKMWVEGAGASDVNALDIDGTGSAGKAKAQFQPYLFNKKTIFGRYRDQNLIAGEAEPEMLLGVHTLRNMLYESVQGGTSAMMNQMYDMVKGMQTGNGSAALQQEIINLLNAYLPQLAQLQIVLDSGVLAGAVAPGVDSALGGTAGYKRRYNA